MPRNYDPADPIGEVVLALGVPKSGTGTKFGVKSVRIPLGTGNSDASANWRNPEGGTCLAKVMVVIRTVGSGGTFDVGVSTAGTGSNDNMINGGTVDAVNAIASGAVTGTAVTGNPSEWYIIQPNGKGGDSIVMKHNDAAGTGTLAGDLVVMYVPIA